MQGAITIGNHADIVVWQPEVEFELNDDHPVYLKHPVCVNLFSLINHSVIASLDLTNQIKCF